MARFAVSLMYGRYTALTAPGPAKNGALSMGIRIVLTGPRVWIGAADCCPKAIQAGRPGARWRPDQITSGTAGLTE